MSRPGEDNLSTEAISYLVNHVVLPPRLPQGNDASAQNESTLIQKIIQCLREFKKKIADQKQAQHVEDVISTINNLSNSRDTAGSISESQLTKLLKNLRTGITNGAILLHIKEQNAGILIRGHGDLILFESFELSPLNEAVIAAKGRLIRSFPACAATISLKQLKAKGLQAMLGQTITKLASQPALGFQPKVLKAGQYHDEIRDATHPGMITNYFMNVIAALGEPIKVSGISKHTREEVMWSNSRQPWRRSPLWLLLRVCMQLQFSRAATASDSESLYKPFMIFFLTRILDLARGHHKELETELLHVITVKLSRRIGKMNHLSQLTSSPAWMVPIRKSVTITHDLIYETWAGTMKKAQLYDNQTLLGLRPENDLDGEIPGLVTFIKGLISRQHVSSPSDFQPKDEHIEFAAHDLPITFGESGDNQCFSLTRFEIWVACNLQNWLDRHIAYETTCGRLRDAMLTYHGIAKTAYKGLPVNISIMYLTIMELWVACDKSACHVHPLLCEFDPQVPVELLQSLLLPRKEHMKRLQRIESYIPSRRNSAVSNAPSLFREFGHKSSFAVKFFDQTPSHQEMLSNIIKRATEDRDTKLAELSIKKQRYKDYMADVVGKDCDYQIVRHRTYNYEQQIHHAHSCRKCLREAMANQIEIRVHEWPLPIDPSVAKAIIFETMAPVAFRKWRDGTLFLLLNVLESDYQTQQRAAPKYTLGQDQGLLRWSAHLEIRYKTERLILVSQTKANIRTHRNLLGQKSILNIEEVDVCVNNGLQYRYYDKEANVFTAVSSPTGRLSQHCTYQLPARSSQLQKYLSRSSSHGGGVPPNEVVASQSECPAHMSLDEFKAFGALPLGSNIQYMNILTQLSMPVLDFAKVEAQCLISQTIYRAGLPVQNKVERNNHAVLTDQAFGDAMVLQLQSALQRVTENWESWRTLAILIQLASRLLSLTASLDIKQQCLCYLGQAREISFKWLDVLKSRAQASTDDGQRSDLYSRAVEVALVCTSTLDLDKEHMESLIRVPSTASVFLQCSILIQENKAFMSSKGDPVYRGMLQAWRTLTCHLSTTLKRQILNNRHNCLDQAVRFSWSGYRSRSSWNSLGCRRDHWLVSESSSGTVHFNILTAELLVNGLPLARLPLSYMQHPMYSSLFRQSSLQVVPTTMPGFEFSAKHKIRGNDLCFGMKGPDMLVCAIQDQDCFDVLPSRLFAGKLPTSFVKDFIHWYDHKNKQIEFRPLDDPWSTSSNHWRLTKVGSSWRLTKPRARLLNITSHTMSVLSGIFAPLENSMYIHIQLNESSNALEIDLPRLQLGFILDNGHSHISSRQYRGMIIDQNQNTGTLVGLESKLILKHENREEDRLVLIPEGPVTYAKSHHHVSVSIGKESVARVHAYHLDTTLSRLRDNGNMQSKLFACYLHALTSHCLPDPLTGYTGTESAITILRSAAVRSFDILTKGNISTLHLIAGLPPNRCYYPKNERVMEDVQWNRNLPTLSQDSNLYVLVQEIFDLARLQKFLYPKETYVEPAALEKIELHLLQRDLLRCSTFRLRGFGAEHASLRNDREYQARDRKNNCERARRSFVAARLVLRDQQALHSGPISFPKSCFQGIISGPTRNLEPLSYDSQWLKDPFTYVPGMWCALHSSLANFSAPADKFNFMMWLSAAAFSVDADMDLIQALAALYWSKKVKSVVVPQVDTFYLSNGKDLVFSEIEDLVKNAVRDFNDSPEADLPPQANETKNNYYRRRAVQYETNRDMAIQSLARHFQSQWPCREPQTSHDRVVTKYLDVSVALKQTSKKFKAWHCNRQFDQYLNQVALALNRHSIAPVIKPEFGTISITQPELIDVPAYTMKGQLNMAPPVVTLKPPPGPDILLQELPTTSRSTETTTRLTLLCEKLRTQVRSKCEKDYVVHLEMSFSALRESTSQSWTVVTDSDVLVSLQTYLKECKVYANQLHAILDGSLQEHPQQSPQSIATTIQHSYRTPTTFWLSQLSKDYWPDLSSAWKAIIVKYGLAIVELQRARRLLPLSQTLMDLAEELQNTGHQNWDPADYPESLLLEAESGIMIRDVQEAIASQMRSPPDEQNSVMQMNMGEGKSSVIVPIVAATIANSSRLARVIVAKPQSKQMFQMLVEKLSGLLNRRIYHMPFSRALRLSQSQADAIGKIYQECIANGGILLVQPEHILSFKLMGIECMLSNQHSTGLSLLRTQGFFDTKSRDIVDESDENFSVKFELVYTMGTQRPIEMSPERWAIIQTILGLVSRFAHAIKINKPAAIEVDDRWPGRFPRVRLLREDANDQLLDCLAKHICDYGLVRFPLALQSSSVRSVIFRYITQPDLSTEDIDAVEKGEFWTDSTKDCLLLIRGLLAGGVLRFALGSKRWRVNFGIDPSRTPKTKLAVPFRSKDSPSLRSEFSHPDVIIVLTSLTYYYGGLDDEDLFIAFSHLLKSDQADVEYAGWVGTAGPDFPEAFRQLAGINIKDRYQCVNQVYPILRFSKNVIDYFLAHLVFPKEMKEFPQKLSASGWDIGERKSHPTTGFSGTNDSRHFLPLSVQHLDLPMQRHTNALVLAYLLQDENGVEMLPPRDASMSSDAEHLLAIVNKMSPPTRVILDVGAQILELNNRQVAEKWLSIGDEGSTKAVVFFNDDEELSVLDRRGKIELLQVSSFAKQLGDCLIYLDEAHTRGTDLVLPRGYRAAVTLGANLTKDRLVQACMRMRKLGKGQSVVFCVSEEIKTKILEWTSKPRDAVIEITDVLTWAISESWADLRRGMPLWATQGRRFEEHKQLLSGEKTSVEQAELFLEDEAQTVEHRYRPRSLKQPEEPRLDGWDTTNENVAQIIARCRDFETMNFNSATLQEEQERELSPEIEEERQVERPTSMTARSHELHPDLVRVVEQGVMILGSQAFVPAFRSLSSTSAASHFSASQFPTQLLVTTDFKQTVKRPQGRAGNSFVSDSFQNTIQWILSIPDAKSGAVQWLVVLSPFEANELLPIIRQTSKVTLHLYSPRSNISYQPLDSLDLYTIGRDFSPTDVPRPLTVLLNLFAGQLYLRSFGEYKEMCGFLGLAWSAAEDGQVVTGDGYIKSARGEWKLKRSPVNFLRVLLTKVRRNCEGVEKTHMGKILDGALLEERDFE